MSSSDSQLLWPRCPPHSVAGMNYSGLHDSSMAVVAPSGEIVWACSEERLSRVKQDGRFPKHLIEVADWRNIDALVLPYGKHEPQSEIESLSRDEWVGLRSRPHQLAFEEMPAVYAERVAMFPRPVIQIEHHLAHAAAAYFLNGESRAAVFTFDAGAFNSPWYAAWYIGEEGRLRQLGGLMAHKSFPVSRLYTAVTALLGFTPNKHEGKITALVAHGKVTKEATEALERIYREVLDEAALMGWVDAYSLTDAPRLVIDDDVRHLALSCLDGIPMCDIAATVQGMAEQQVVRIATWLRQETGLSTICLAGGLFANVKINQSVWRCGYSKVFVAPPMTDDGLALGAALYEANRRGAPCLRPIRSMCMGPANPTDHLDDYLNSHGVVFQHLKRPAEELAALIHRGDIVATCEGRLEFGPRALGRRSILVRATDPNITDLLNHKLRRTEFMPFAPIVRAEDAEACFIGLRDLAHSAEFMTIAIDCTEMLKAKCPAIVHVDGTARPQIVHADQHPLLHGILTAYQRLSGCPALVNTSFNVHEEPIVCSSEDALRAFFHSELDHLFLEGRLISRVDNPRCLPAFLPRKRSAHRIIRAQPSAARQREAEFQQLRKNFEWVESQWKAWREVAQQQSRTLAERDRVCSGLEDAQHRSVDEQRELQQRYGDALKEARETIAAMEASIFWRFGVRLKAMFPREALRGRVLRRLGRIVR